jgi:hypothetical protein
MRKSSLVVVSVLALALVIFFGWLFVYGGLRYYLRAEIMIAQSKVSAENKIQVKLDFFGDGSNQFEYRGTLARVENGGIWVWGRTGLKYFKTDKDSVFHFTDGCLDIYTVQSEKNAGKEIEVNDEIFTDITKWGQKARVGDYVIVLSRSNIGLFGGGLGEVLTFNNWFFLQVESKIACQK